MADGKPQIERNLAIVRAAHTKSAAAVAREFKISPGRVSQIIHAHNRRVLMRTLHSEEADGLLDLNERLEVILTHALRVLYDLSSWTRDNQAFQKRVQARWLKEHGEDDDSIVMEDEIVGESPP